MKVTAGVEITRTRVCPLRGTEPGTKERVSWGEEGHAGEHCGHSVGRTGRARHPYRERSGNSRSFLRGSGAELTEAEGEAAGGVRAGGRLWVQAEALASQGTVPPAGWVAVWWGHSSSRRGLEGPVQVLRSFAELRLFFFFYFHFWSISVSQADKNKKHERKQLRASTEGPRRLLWGEQTFCQSWFLHCLLGFLPCSPHLAIIIVITSLPPGPAGGFLSARTWHQPWELGPGSRVGLVSRSAVPSDKSIHCRASCEARAAPELGQAWGIQAGTRGNPGKGGDSRGHGQGRAGIFGTPPSSLDCRDSAIKPILQAGDKRNWR